MCERSDGKDISEDEAFFIAGIFNLGLVERFIYASSDNRSFKIRPPIYVPLFQPSNAAHKLIARFARQAAATPENKRSPIMAQLEAAYLKLCESR
jgi:hypothetical protein